MIRFYSIYQCRENEQPDVVLDLAEFGSLDECIDYVISLTDTIELNEEQEKTLEKLVHGDYHLIVDYDREDPDQILEFTDVMIH